LFSFKFQSRSSAFIFPLFASRQTATKTPDERDVPRLFCRPLLRGIILITLFFKHDFNERNSNKPTDNSDFVSQLNRSVILSPWLSGVKRNFWLQAMCTCTE